MPFLQKKEKRLDKMLSNEQLFEKFMIEIGQFKPLPNGGLEMSGEFIPTGKLKARFDMWLSSNKFK